MIYLLGFHSILLSLLYILSTFKLLLTPVHNLSSRYGSSWAIVTGASDGIG